MAISNVTKKYKYPSKSRSKNAKSGMSCIKYVMDDSIHNKDTYVNKRNERITTSCFDFKNVAKSIFDNQGANIELYSIVQSFNDNELDYTNQADIDMAHQIGVETAQRLNESIGKREFGVFTQIDGERHRIHNHILYLNCDKNGTPLDHEISWKRDLSPISDRITAKYLTNTTQRKEQAKMKRSRDEVLNTPKPSRKGKRKEAIKYIDENVRECLKRANSIQNLENMLLERQILIRRRQKQEQSELSLLFTKSGKYRKNIAFEYHGTVVRSSVFNLSPYDVQKAIGSNKEKAKKNRETVEKTVNRDVQHRSKNSVKKHVQKTAKTVVHKVSNPKQTKPVIKPKPQKKQISRAEFEQQLESKPLSYQLNYWKNQYQMMVQQHKNKETNKDYVKVRRKVYQLRELITEQESMQSVKVTQYTTYQQSRQYDGPNL